MNIYVIHREKNEFAERLYGKGCGIPVLMIKRDAWPEAWEKNTSYETFFLDGVNVTGAHLGPCQHCGGSFEIKLHNLITEEEYKRRCYEWPVGFEKIHHCTKEPPNGNEKKY